MYDDAFILPQAHRSSEGGGFKNVAVKLDGVERDLTSDLFSPNWFSGVSAVAVPAELAEALLRDPRRRAQALERLVAAIPSEMESSDVQVGPTLDGDDQDRDVATWTAGFDAPGCCVGLYSAQQSRSPDAGVTGMHRIHNAYFLVCKAGGGLAAQTFHSRLTAALRKGLSLDEALCAPGASPGPQGLRRVGLAAQRNRGRILEMAARAIGFHSVDTIGDNASPPGEQYRMAITQLNVHTNVLRDVEGSARSQWMYSAGCVDAAVSQGVLAASNPHEGFVAFTDSNGGYKINVRNISYNCLPFSSVRIANNRDIVMKAADAHKRAIDSGERPHPDGSWIRERFAWRDRGAQHGVTLEPPPLWGTYGSEEFVTAFGRELGISSCRVVRMQPEIVAIAGTESAKLRAAAKHVSKR